MRMNDEKPPGLKGWNAVYWLMAVFLGCCIWALHLFTVHFR